MSDYPTNGFPPHPGGVGQRGGIVPTPSPRSGGPGISVPSGLLSCALGGAVASSTFAFLAPVFVGYGYVSTAHCGGAGGRVAGAAVALVASVAMSLSHGASSVVVSVVSCLVAIATAEALLRGRLTPGLGCLVVAAAAACTLCADAALTAAAGTTLGATVESLLDSLMGELAGASLAAAELMQRVRSAVSLLWPTAYVATAFGTYLFAVIGAGQAAGRITEKSVEIPRFAAYDLPLWVVAVLVGSAAVLAFGLTAQGAVASAAVMVSANLVMALRFAFAAQGLAVLAWSLDRRGTGLLAKVLLGALALYLEVQFVVMTVVGLVDVWANLRHLPRGEAADAQGTA